MSFARLSAEIIALILDQLDTGSLWRCYKASHRFSSVVLNNNQLQYKLELALTSMKDGIHADFPVSLRLQQLLSHRKAWPQLAWASHSKVPIRQSRIIGLSSSYFYIAATEPTGCTLSLEKLQSFRSSRMLNVPERVRYPCAIEGCAVDQSQNLLVACELFRPAIEEIWVRLYFRNLQLASVQNHGLPFGEFIFFTGWGELDEVVSLSSLEVCGSCIGITARIDLESASTTKLFLIDWQNREVISWIRDVVSFHLIDETRMLVISPPEEEDEDDLDEQAPIGHQIYEPYTLSLHDIIHLTESEDSSICSFELPDQWDSSTSIKIIKNRSPRSAVEAEFHTMFFADPGSRAVVLAVTFAPDQIPPDFSKRNVIVLEESYFKTVSMGEPVHLRVPWDQWRRNCLIHALPDTAHSLNLVGRRLLFAEHVHVEEENDSLAHSKIHLIDFNPLVVDYTRRSTNSAPPWTWNNHWNTVSTVHANGRFPYLETTTVDALPMTGLFATEDNIVLAVKDEDDSFLEIFSFGETPPDRVEHQA